jgi:magnesium chelatase accessory protein
LPQGEPSDWPNRHLSRFVEAAGIRWHVQQTHAGEPLLLVHGTGASTHSWRDIIPILGAEYSVLAPDLPGHGFTDAVSPARSTIGGMSESLALLLETLEVTPRYCVGHSAGAVILCRMALDRRIQPAVIVSLNGAFMPLKGAAGVLFSPLAKLLSRSSFLPRLVSRRAANSANVARVLEGTGSKLDAVGLDLYTRLVRDPKHVAGALNMMGNWDLHAFERDLPRLATPLALLVAANDRTVPPDQARLVAQRLPHARIQILPGLGHLAHEEEPARVGEAIRTLCRMYGAPT